MHFHVVLEGNLHLAKEDGRKLYLEEERAPSSFLETPVVGSPPILIAFA